VAMAAAVEEPSMEVATAAVVSPVAAAAAALASSRQGTRSRLASLTGWSGAVGLSVSATETCFA
jgi:hypothetical protein